MKVLNLMRFKIMKSLTNILEYPNDYDVSKNAKHEHGPYFLLANQHFINGQNVRLKHVAESEVNSHEVLLEPVIVVLA